mmetsp:Transcript_7286/g.25855  ORF Transcript_7286/g.25855 Transcript_7286/m.25855 type:complete len:222 (-) Transcript_7286:713-1378(-)
MADTVGTDERWFGSVRSDSVAQDVPKREGMVRVPCRLMPSRSSFDSRTDRSFRSWWRSVPSVVPRRRHSHEFQPCIPLGLHRRLRLHPHGHMLWPWMWTVDGGRRSRCDFRFVSFHTGVGRWLSLRTFHSTSLRTSMRPLVRVHDGGGSRGRARASFRTGGAWSGIAGHARWTHVDLAGCVRCRVRLGIRRRSDRFAGCRRRVGALPSRREEGAGVDRGPT